MKLIMINAIGCGGLLLEEETIKERMILARRAGISRRTMYNYMDVYQYRDLVEQAPSMREALRMIRKARGSATRCTGWLAFDDEGCAVKAHG